MNVPSTFRFETPNVPLTTPPLVCTHPAQQLETAAALAAVVDEANTNESEIPVPIIVVRWATPEIVPVFAVIVVAATDEKEPTCCPLIVWPARERYMGVRYPRAT